MCFANNMELNDVAAAEEEVEWGKKKKTTTK
jgi:hypothetical protein